MTDKEYRNTPKRKAYMKSYEEKYRQKPERKAYMETYWKEYRKQNRENLNKYRRDKRKADPLFKLETNIRSNINKAIRRKGYTKRSKNFDILGCTYEEFKTYLESKFEPWMGWHNYGMYNGEANYGWDIDHIVPIDNARSEDDVIKLNHYTNLQPLCSYYNRDVKINKKAPVETGDFKTS